MKSRSRYRKKQCRNRPLKVNQNPKEERQAMKEQIDNYKLQNGTLGQQDDNAGQMKTV